MKERDQQQAIGSGKTKDYMYSYNGLDKDTIKALNKIPSDPKRHFRYTNSEIFEDEDWDQYDTEEDFFTLDNYESYYG